MVAMATAAQRLLRQGEKKGGGEGTRWLFWKIPCVSFPQETKLEENKTQQKSMGIWGLEEKGENRPHSVLRVAFLTTCASLLLREASQDKDIALDRPGQVVPHSSPFAGLG